MTTKARHWAQEYFLDYPHYLVNEHSCPAEVWALPPTNSAPGKPKVACSACMEYEIGCIQASEDSIAQADPTYIPGLPLKFNSAVCSFPSLKQLLHNANLLL